LLGSNADFYLARFADCRHSEICQIIDELGTAREIASNGNFDVGERVVERDEPVSKQIDTKKVRVRDNLCPDRGLQLERTGGLAPGVTKIGLVLKTDDREHGKEISEFGKGQGRPFIFAKSLISTGM